MEFSDFHKDVLSQLPGAPIPAVNYALLQAAITYCEDSLCLQYDTDAVIVRANVNEYEVPLLDEETDLHMIVKAMLDGREVKPIAVDNRPITMSPAQTYETFAEETDDAQSIRLIETPESSGTLLLRVAVKPKQDATTLPDDLWRHHRAGICAGAMAQMMLQLGKAWPQPTLGVVREKQFRAYIAQAQVDANRAGTRAELRVRARPFC